MLPAMKNTESAEYIFCCDNTDRRFVGPNGALCWKHEEEDGVYWYIVRAWLEEWKYLLHGTDEGIHTLDYCCDCKWRLYQAMGTPCPEVGKTVIGGKS